MRAIAHLFIILVTLSSLGSQALEKTVNFMWLNNEIVPANKFIFPEMRKKEDWDISITQWMEAWLKGFPKQKFVFWFDENTVTKEQISSTQDLFDDLMKKHDVDLILQSTNNFALVKNNPDIFKDPRLTYVKVDLLRLIAAVDYVEKCKDKCAFVYVDIDKGFENDNGDLKWMNITNEDLFNTTTFASWHKETTTGLLEENGFLMRTGPENSFFILSNHQPHMIDAIKLAVIDANILRAKNEYLPLLENFENVTDVKPLTLANLKIDDKYLKIDKETRVKMRELYRAMINGVFNSMIKGPMLAYYRFKKGDVSLMPDLDLYLAGGLANVFSKLDTEGENYFFDTRTNDKIMQVHSKVFGQQIFDLLNNDLIPQLGVGGSDSQSYKAPGFLNF